MHRRLPRWIFVYAWAIACFSLISQAAGQQAVPQSGDKPDPPSVAEKPDWLETVLHAAVPHEYENRKHWDKTKSLVVGVGGKIFKPRLYRKQLRHGTWRRSHVTLVEPDERLKLELKNIKHTEPAGQQFDLAVSARVDLFYQQQEWRRGLRIYSVSGTATADLEMSLNCDMTFEVQPSVLLPKVTLSPQVNQADIHLKRFRLKSLGDADGPVVREIGEIFEGEVRDHLRDKEKDIVKKINRSIDKRSDRLQISLVDLAAGQWTKHFTLPSEKDKKSSAAGATLR